MPPDCPAGRVRSIPVTPRPRIRRIVACVIVGLLGGCALGPRPKFADDPFPAGSNTGDASIDPLLRKLDSVSTGPFTATYTVLTKYGNTTHPATVTADPGRRSVTIASTRYLTFGSTLQTCVFSPTASCSTGFDLTKVSDTSITPDFYAGDVAKRIRRKATAAIGPTTATSETIAGQRASCVSVPLPGGTAMYCVLDIGVLARMDDGDVAVSMLNYSASATENLFSSTTP